MKFLNTTKKWADWWKNRKVDWEKDYLSTWNHPHRLLIVNILKQLNWISLLEIGCGSGPNLYAIVKDIPGKQVGGFDVNEKAIELAKKTFRNGIFKVGSGDDLMISDKATDITLTDMCLIYVDPFKIDDYMKEIKRITRNYVLFCEFHSESFYDIMRLKITSGYNAHNFKKLLEKHDFYDVSIYKLKPEDWPGGEPQKTFGHIVLAKVPTR